MATRKCFVKNCADDWTSLRLMGDKRATPKYHVCPCCGRGVCSIHSVSTSSVPFGPRFDRRLTIIYSPPVCIDCVTTTLRARRNRKIER